MAKVTTPITSREIWKILEDNPELKELHRRFEEIKEKIRKYTMIPAGPTISEGFKPED